MTFTVSLRWFERLPYRDVSDEFVCLKLNEPSSCAILTNRWLYHH